MRENHFNRSVMLPSCVLNGDIDFKKMFLELLGYDLRRNYSCETPRNWKLEIRNLITTLYELSFLSQVSSFKFQISHPIISLIRLQGG